MNERAKTEENYIIVREVKKGNEREGAPGSYMYLR